MGNLTKSMAILLAARLLIFSACKKDKFDTPRDAEYYDVELTFVENLGKRIFFDKNLSSPVGQSCASCHSIEVAFSDPNHLAFSQGAISTQIGTRNTPAIGYLKYAPALYYNTVDSTYMGGLFWDGSANSLEEQMMKPLLNPIEMNNASKTEVVNKLKHAEYSRMFRDYYGANVFDDTNKVIQITAAAIAAFERSAQVSPFTSKYDYYLKGQVLLSEQEMRGLTLFNDTIKAKCINCHPSTFDNAYELPLFTDFSYDNIGVPHNPSSPSAAPDNGLGAFLNDRSNDGKFKVPTLRNVALTAPYMHNGFFKTLEDVVIFYSDRDSAGLFPPPEVSDNVNRDELGQLNLTKQDVEDIVAFLKTLTDGYKKEFPERAGLK
jgi:cytochrome c peroxidase